MNAKTISVYGLRELFQPVPPSPKAQPFRISSDSENTKLEGEQELVNFSCQVDLDFNPTKPRAKMCKMQTPATAQRMQRIRFDASFLNPTPIEALLGLVHLLEPFPQVLGRELHLARREDRSKERNRFGASGKRIQLLLTSEIPRSWLNDKSESGFVKDLIQGSGACQEYRVRDPCLNVSTFHELVSNTLFQYKGGSI